jgi:hypothetical protein
MPNRAIVVGIQGYPELVPELQGPRNDATKFFNWVTTAGGVAPQDAKLILDQEPLSATALDAKPTVDAIKYEFDRLETEATSPTWDANGRLYLYLSGHGFGQSLDDAALLMANATMARTRHHIPGRLWADFFFANGYFKEVLLFLDCCRERYRTALLNGPGTVVPNAPPMGARRFYGFATKYGKLAVERMIDGQQSGVFTATLLDALNGGAAEEDGRITGESLKAYLYENMSQFLTPEDRNNSDVATEPDLYCDQPEAQFLITTVQAPKYQVQIPLPPSGAAGQLQLFGEQGGKKFTLIAQGAGDASLTWQLNLFRGTYQLNANGTTQIVTVKGRGLTDVVNP